jgi:hypothetical protein
VPDAGEGSRIRCYRARLLHFPRYKCALVRSDVVAAPSHLGRCPTPTDVSGEWSKGEGPEDVSRRECGGGVVEGGRAHARREGKEWARRRRLPDRSMLR